jgi:hypothetical protein
MSESQETVSFNCCGVSVGFVAFALFCIFMTLKLCSVINWSWWWVTAPLWIYGGLMGLIIVGFILFAIFALVIGLIIKARK